MTTPDERPKPTYKTRPAVPRSSTYIPSEQRATVAADQERSMTPTQVGGTGLAPMALLFGIGGVLFLLGLVVSFNATSIFVAVFFAALMVIGGCAVVGGAVISALRPS